MVFLLVVIFIIYLINVKIIYTAIHAENVAKPLLLGLKPKDYDDGEVTVVIMTYQRIDDLLNNPLMKNIIPLDIVKELIIIWNYIENLSQISQIEEAFNDWGLSHKLRIVIPKENSLNNRFMPIPNITTSALYSTDDEWTTSVDNFLSAYQWWKLNPKRLVGFVPRRLEKNKGYISFPDYDYLPVVNKQPYNILLPGGGMFFSVDYMYKYAEQTTNKVKAREHVDTVFNCEDILFNFMIPKEFHPPLLVAINNTETQYYTHRKNGLSSKPVSCRES